MFPSFLNSDSEPPRLEDEPFGGEAAVGLAGGGSVDPRPEHGGIEQHLLAHTHHQPGLELRRAVLGLRRWIPQQPRAGRGRELVGVALAKAAAEVGAGWARCLQKRFGAAAEVAAGPGAAGAVGVGGAAVPVGAQ